MTTPAGDGRHRLGLVRYLPRSHLAEGRVPNCLGMRKRRSFASLVGKPHGVGADDGVQAVTANCRLNGNRWDPHIDSRPPVGRLTFRDPLQIAFLLRFMAGAVARVSLLEPASLAGVAALRHQNRFAVEQRAVMALAAGYAGWSLAPESG